MTMTQPPRIGDRVIVIGREGWWTVLQVDPDGTVTMRRTAVSGPYAVRHFTDLETLQS